MRIPRLSQILIAGALVFATESALGASYSLGPTAKSKKENTAPGAEIFDNKHVLQIRIEISSNELGRLRRNDREYVRATVYEGSNVWRDVGVHVKGGAGSHRLIDDSKPSLTLSFNKFTPDQRFHGLRTIHLNNSVQDGSYMTENICSELFRKAKVPTPRVSFATVELNGRRKEFYVLKEGFAKEMLGLYFKNTEGNLYDGGFLREVTDQLERNRNGNDGVRDWSDLKALAKAAQEPDTTKRWEELSRVLDVDRFISFCALEVMTWDWDGYFMNRNNYRVYHDLDTGKMVFFPHGMDQMFWEPARPILPPDKIEASLVGSAVLKTPQGQTLYRERFSELFTNVFQIEVLTNRVSELATLIRPELVKIDGESFGRDYDGQVNRIRSLIIARFKSLETQLSFPDRRTP